MFTVKRVAQLSSDAFLVEYLQVGWERAVSRMLQRMSGYNWDFNELQATERAPR